MKLFPARYSPLVLTLGLILILTTTLNLPAPLAQAANNTHKGMWVWDMSDALLNNTGGAQDTFFNFIVAPKGDASFKLTHIYFEARTYNKDTDPNTLNPVITDPLTNPALQPSLRAFIQRAHSLGIQVEYLDGDASWVKSTTNRQIPVSICQAVVDFNAGGTVDQRFDGVHYDIEPHTLGTTWRQNGGVDGYNDTYENNMIFILQSCNNKGLHITNDTGTDYAAYVTELWNAYMAGGVLDYITIMNYFDTQAEWINGTVDGGGVAQNLQLDTLGLQMVFGVETIADAGLADISFAQEGYTCMKSVFDYSGNLYANNAKYWGVSVHYYTPFKAMTLGSCTTATPTRTNTPIGPTATRTNTPIAPTNTPTRTNTPTGPTNTPTSTLTRTNTPIGPTNTPTRTNTPTASMLKVQFYNWNRTSPSTEIAPFFKIVNLGSTSVSLSTLKMRYWFTKDSGTPSVTCDWLETMLCTSVTTSLVAMGTPKTNADEYLEIGFTSGTLAANANTGEMQFTIARSSGSYTQTNDYSFNSTATNYVDWNKVTLYQNSVLVWGVEP
jgi:hypothetical protein